MNAIYSFHFQEQIPILIIRDLLGEYANKEIVQAVNSKIAEGLSNFVVDLSDIQFMNSVGLNCLISLEKKTKEAGGQIVLTNCSTKVLQLLKMTKLDDIFLMAPNVMAAIEVLSEKA
ncbi:MAG: STAS domain-containing protein [Chitinophagales bacterium]|nr:STAS domain-containing protein [Chitinophagales bacterium]